jgi:hypothetical protein
MGHLVRSTLSASENGSDEVRNLVSTLFGSSLMVSRSEDGSVLLNETTRIITGDILASNGASHHVLPRSSLT